MSRPIQIQNHPFQFLLYLEWMLLAVTALTEAMPTRRYPHLHVFPHYPQMTIFCLVIFGLMGLRLPAGRQINKILYTAAEFFLIFLIALASNKEIRLFPSIYLILVIRSCLIFPLPGRLLVTGLSFSLFGMAMFRRFQHLANQPLVQERFKFVPLVLALSFGLSLLFVLLFMNTMIAERQIREKLAIANEKLRQYALRIEDQATLQERNRIAREIHDSLGHSLTALNLQLETAVKLWESNPAKAQAFLIRSKELGSKALQDVRQSVLAMRSHPLQQPSLEAGIAILVDDVRRSISVSPDVEINLNYPIYMEILTAIYRITQEALTNICKHAIATQIMIKVNTNNTGLKLIVSDNGRGFDIKQNTTGFGLQSMRDRTLALGGKFQLDSAPNAGCKITIDIPLIKLSND